MTSKRLNLAPSSWGPVAWKLLHSVAAGYPDRATPQEQASLTQFIHGLPDLLPCAMCRVHFRQEIAADPVEPHVGSRAAIERWLVDLHNRVNARLEKPQLTRDEAAQLMKGDIVGEDPTSSSASSDATIIGLAVAVGVMGV